MKAAKIREMSTDEIMVELNNLKEQLFHLRMEVILGQMQKGTKIQQKRRIIARILTILGERQRNQTQEAGR
ncbi:MAG: 50S ribosomal protein L29 [Acidobacteria bacterium]|nr:50S ribosomal protein L29 [Acidobacteriota bacterium]MBI3657625.1 50S ribosomal protein L29 [Acidobacteriota bacterium]